MALVDVLLIAVVAILGVIGLVALRYPRGREEWPLDGKQTAWAIGSGLTAVLVFVLLFVATKDVRWPDATVTLTAAAALGLAVLAAAALLLPQGLRARP